MKIITTILFTAWCLLSVAQVYQCEDSGDVTFDMMDCSDDYITFVVTTTGGNSSSGIFTGLPPGTEWNFGLYSNGADFSLVQGQPRFFNVPSLGCAPVNVVFNITENSFPPAWFCEFNVTLNETRNIPTLGQWGLICLSIILVIGGILGIKSKLASTVS